MKASTQTSTSEMKPSNQPNQTQPILHRRQQVPTNRRQRATCPRRWEENNETTSDHIKELLMAVLATERKHFNI